MILATSYAAYLPILLNKSINSPLERSLKEANTKYYLVVKLKYVMCGIFLLLNDLCTVFTGHAAPLGIHGYSYIKVMCHWVETQIKEKLYFRIPSVMCK